MSATPEVRWWQYATDPTDVFGVAADAPEVALYDGRPDLFRPVTVSPLVSPRTEVREAVARVLNPNAWAVYDGCQARGITGPEVDLIVEDVLQLADRALAAASEVSPLVSPRTTPADEMARDLRLLVLDLEDMRQRGHAVGTSMVARVRAIRDAAEAALAASPADADTAEVRPLPVVAHKGPHDTDASMFATAADNLDRGYPLGGGNLTRAVVELIRREVAASSPVAATSEERDR